MNPELLAIYEERKKAPLLRAPAKIYGNKNATTPTKKFLAWNRRAIRAGITDQYIDTSQLYNAQTNRFIKIKYDRRYKKLTEKKAFAKKHPRHGSVLITREGDVDELFTPEKVSYTEIKTVKSSWGGYTETGGEMLYDGSPIEHEGWWFTYFKNSGLQGQKVRVIVKHYATAEQKAQATIDERTTKELKEPIYFTKADALEEIAQKNTLTKNDVYRGTPVVFDKTYNIPTNPSKKMWYDKNRIFDDFRVDSGRPNIVAEMLKLGIKCRIILTTLTTLKPVAYVQQFAEGNTHCLLESVREWAEESHDKAESKKGKERYRTILNKLHGKKTKTKETPGYLQQYAEGIPEDRVADLCDDLQIQISIEQPHRTKQFLECKSLKKPLKHFRYINSRLNHVEHYTTQSKDDHAGEYTPEYLEELAHDLRRDGKHFTFSRNKHGIQFLQTPEKNYSAGNAYNKAKQDFENNNNINAYKIDAIKNPQLVNFLRRGTHFNGTTDFVEELPDINDPDLRHIDIKKAYANFNKSVYYSGFMGKCCHFRPVDNYEQKGFYRIENIDTTNADPRFVFYNEKMKWFASGNIYTDAELRFLADVGCVFSVKYGAYGTRADFVFSEEMIDGKETYTRLNGKELKISFYAKCVGQWASVNFEKSYSMYGEKKYFETLEDKDLKIIYDEYREEATLEYPKKYVPTLTHLAGQITAYQRLLVIEQLLKMDNKKIVRVCVDGIYSMNHPHDTVAPFRPKNEPEDKTFNNSATSGYLSGIIDKIEEFKEATKDEPAHIPSTRRPYNRTELHQGQGGSGKTFGLIHDLGLVNPLYVAPSWKLARRIAQDIKEDDTANKTVKETVKHRVLYMEFNEKLQEAHNVFLWDEFSQYTEKEKNHIIKNIDGVHYFLGDLGHQLEPVIDYKQLSKQHQKSGSNIDLYKWAELQGYHEPTAEGFDAYVNHLTDYRAKDCEDLKKFKLDLRHYIKQGQEEEDPHAKKIIAGCALEFAKKKLPSITQEELRKKYNATDLILCSKHEIINEYNEMFKDKKKLLVKNNTKHHSNSEIIFNDPPAGVKVENTHGFTVHAIQGETLDDPNALFIDTRCLFSYRMLYTAISRARKMTQIFLITK